jgi:hypothetical protein
MPVSPPDARRHDLLRAPPGGGRRRSAGAATETTTPGADNAEAPARILTAVEPDDADDVDDLGSFDEHGSFGSPLPPEDRLWRHPSELSRGASFGDRAPKGHRWSTVVFAAAAGSLTTMVVLAVSGALDVREPGPRPTIVRPAVSKGSTDASGVELVDATSTAQRGPPSWSMTRRQPWAPA